MKSLITATLAGAFAIATSFAGRARDKAPAFTAMNVKGEKPKPRRSRTRSSSSDKRNFDLPFVKRHYSSKNMQKLQADYTGKDVVWLTVELIPAEGKQGYLEGSKLGEKTMAEGSKATEVLVDLPTARLARHMMPKVTPHMMIIAKDGMVAYTGAIDSKACLPMPPISTRRQNFSQTPLMP